MRRFASALRELGAVRDVDEALQQAIDLATELIPGIDVADIMLLRRGEISVPVSTDELAKAVDRVQEETDEGPCLTALRTEEMVVAHDLEDDDRWPQFSSRALELGVRAVMAYRLSVQSDGSCEVLGALNLFGREPIDDGLAVELGAVFAAHCSAVLKAAISEEGLQTALQSRDVIGQAKGILMERHRLTADQAYAVLRRASNDLNIKLRDLAKEVSETGALPTMSPDRRLPERRRTSRGAAL